MAEKSVDLPDECWELIFKLLDNNPSHFNSLSLVSKQFLSITSRLLHTLKLSHQTPQALLHRLLQRFTRLNHIDLAGFQGDMNSTLHQIALSGLCLESVNVSNQATFPALGLRALGAKMANVKSLNCSNTRSLADSDLNLVAESFPCLEELDISYPEHEKGFSTKGLSDNATASKMISDRGIFPMSSKLKALRKINISGNNFITDRSLLFLSINCVLLSHVVIHFCNFITLNGVSKLTRDCSHLIYISVRGIEMPYFNKVPFREPYMSWEASPAIDISECVISDEFLCAVAEARLPVKELILSRCTNYSSAGISCLLNEYQSLECLDLHGADFLTDADMARLSRYLHSVNYINLTSCSMLTNITFYILIEGCLNLDKLEMAGTSIGDENIETDIRVNRGIKSLNLAQNSEIGDGFLRSLASVCPNLELLNLSNCLGITEQGIVHVLKRCSEIRQLVLNCSGVVNNLFKHLELELPKLKVLSLKFARIDDDALAMIGKSCCRLLNLDVAGNLRLTSKGLKEVVENCKELMEINLENCENVGVDIVPWMVFARPSLKKIVPPCAFAPTESQRNLFLRHGCWVSRLRRLAFERSTCE